MMDFHWDFYTWISYKKEEIITIKLFLAFGHQCKYFLSRTNMQFVENINIVIILKYIWLTKMLFWGLDGSSRIKTGTVPKKHSTFLEIWKQFVWLFFFHLLHWEKCLQGTLSLLMSAERSKKLYRLRPDDVLAYLPRSGQWLSILLYSSFLPVSDFNTYVLANLCDVTIWRRLNVLTFVMRVRGCCCSRGWVVGDGVEVAHQTLQVLHLRVQFLSTQGWLELKIENYFQCIIYILM